MKNKTIFLALVIMLSLSSTMAFADNTDPKSPDKNAVPIKTENKLSEEELSRLTRRVEEIRDMDKTNLTAKEKRALRKEIKEIKENVKKQGGYVYVGLTTLLLIVILVILLA
jgi:uncharacterized ferredoxin-like protein